MQARLEDAGTPLTGHRPLTTATILDLTPTAVLLSWSATHPIPMSQAMLEPPVSSSSCQPSQLGSGQIGPGGASSGLLYPVVRWLWVQVSLLSS